MDIKKVLKIDQNWTPERAKNDLERLMSRDGHPADKVIALVCMTLEKQIPKNVNSEFSSHAIYDNGSYIDQLDISTFKCPICGLVLASGEIDKSDCVRIHYCDNCGQALDWSDTE